MNFLCNPLAVWGAEAETFTIQYGQRFGLGEYLVAHPFLFFCYHYIFALYNEYFYWKVTFIGTDISISPFLIVVLPLLNFLGLARYGREIGRTGSIFFTTSLLVLIVLFSAFFWWEYICTLAETFVNFGSWIRVAALIVDWEFCFDALSLSILLIVSIISFLVHIYSFSYIKNDPSFIRFISFLSLFTFFMFMLVTASNLVQIFVGWEGVGICSFLLINFWYTRIQANKAALKAIFINKVGDIGFLFGLSLTFLLFGSVDFKVLEVIAQFTLGSEPMYYILDTSFLMVDIICFWFAVGVIGKSAQVGLHTWLPAAIEGPTPVSALIHAATMVTAGIFLLIRLSFLFEYSENIRNIIVVFGAVTALLSAVTALFVYDIKKIIAYSTCSQLGYMAVACGLSQYSLGFFHLINHAFFKALLFLTAGALIHSFNNEQDIRRLSGLSDRIPFIFTAFIIGNVAIMGLPFLSGFFSKDLILEVAYLNADSFWVGGFNVIYCFLIIATFFTGAYSIRLVYFLFLRSGSARIGGVSSAISQDFFTRFPLLVLIVGSIFSGYFLNDFFNTTNRIFWVQPRVVFQTAEFLSIKSGNVVLGGFVDTTKVSFLENEYLPWYVKLIPFFLNMVCILGLFLFWFLYENQKIPHLVTLLIYSLDGEMQPESVIEKFFFSLFTRLKLVINKCALLCINNFYFNEFYNFLALFFFDWGFSKFLVNIDKGVLELFGPTGLLRVYKWLSQKIMIFFFGPLQVHIFTIFSSVLWFSFLFLAWI